MPQNGIPSSIGLLECGIKSIYSEAELDWGIATFSGPQASSSSSTGLPLPVHRAAVLEGFRQYYCSTLSFQLSLHTCATKRIYLHTHTLSPREDCCCLAHCARVMFGGGGGMWLVICSSFSVSVLGRLCAPGS